MKKTTFLLVFLLSLFIYNYSYSQSGTIDFSTADGTNLGATADDGEGGSSDISGVVFNIFIANGSGVATGGDIFFDNTSATYQGLSATGNPGGSGFSEMILETADGSEFDFNGFYAAEYGGAAISLTVEGFKDGSSTGSETLVLSAAFAFGTATYSTGDLPDAKFGDVDEVRITESGGGSIFGAFDAFVIAPVAAPADTTPPEISSVSLAADNSYIDVTFSEGVYDTGGGSGALETGDFALAITGGSATSPIVTSVTTTGGGALSGGETTIRVNFATTGAADGGETLEVDLTASSIFDAAGNAAVADQTANNTASMNDQAAPVFSAVSPSSSSSVNTANVGYTLSEALTSGTVTFTRTSGTADGSSPHMVSLTGTELNAGTFSVAALTNAPTLVDGAVYTISFDGQDAAGNNATTVSSTSVTFDTTDPSFSAPFPSANSGINIADVGYTISEAIASGTVTFTRTSGTADPSSPHVVSLTGSDLNSGTRAFGPLTSPPTLVNGTTYTITFDATDAAGNVATPLNLVSVFYDNTVPMIDFSTTGSGVDEVRQYNSTTGDDVTYDDPSDPAFISDDSDRIAQISMTLTSGFLTDFSERLPNDSGGSTTLSPSFNISATLGPVTYGSVTTVLYSLPTGDATYKFTKHLGTGYFTNAEATNIINALRYDNNNPGSMGLTDRVITFTVTDFGGNVSAPAVVTMDIIQTPVISSVSLATDNSYVDVTFSEAVYNTNGGSGAVETSDFALSITGGTATSPTVTSVTTTGGAALSGGETTIRVNFSTTGTASGAETLEVDITDGSSIFNLGGTAADADQTSNNTATLNDVTAPSISSVSLDGSNGFIDVTFTEGVFNTGGGSGAIEASDFALSITGGSATSPTVTSVTTTGGAGLSGGETTIRVNFSVTGTPDGAETLEVDITDGTSIFDAAGNGAAANQTSNNTATLNDEAGPVVSSVSLASDNAYVDVTFSEGVFNTGGGSGALEASDFALSLTGGSATSPTVTSVTTTGGAGLSGGETTIRVNFSYTGAADGGETLEVDLTDGTSVFDAAGNAAAANQTSNNTVALNSDGPVFSTSATQSVAEGNTAVVTLAATGTGTINYSIVGGADQGDFSISGADLSFNPAPDFESPADADTNNDYIVQVRATDDTGSTDLTLTVTVTDENDNSPVFSTSATQNVAEGNTAVVTLASTDGDAGASVSYSIIGGDDQGLFSLTGADLSFSAAPDFEAPGDANTDNDHIVQVQADDGVNQTNLTITVSVTDENDNAPVFTTSATQNVAEGNTAVVTLASTDVDTGSSVSYSIVGGADQALFSLTGADLSFAFTPDFETPIDDNNGNDYEVQIQAHDGANVSSLTISVSITDENDNSPVFTTSATQNVAEGNTAVVTLASTDADAGASVSYSIVGGADQADFSLTGADLSFAATPDFEVPADADTNNDYVVQVQADDGVNQTNLTITVTVTDENDNAPVFTTSATQNVAENTTAVVTLASTDVDTGSSVSYSIIGGDDQGLFSLAGADLSFGSAPDFESPGDANTDNDYVVQVQANDGVNTTNLTITVTVTDDNDNAPVFTTSTTQSVAENTTAVVTLASTDVDTGSSVSYSIIGGADQGLFSLTGADLSFSSAPDFEVPGDADTDNDYIVQVQANDGVNTTDLTITVTVTDENDNAPVFTTSAAQSIPENSTPVVTLMSTDADTGSSVTYSIIGGADQGLFSLTGADLSFSTAPDFEAPGDANGDNDYEVQVQANDGVNTTDLTIVVTVTDVDEIPPTVTLSTTSPSPTNTTFTVTFTFSEPVMGWDLTDINVTNGTASIFNQIDPTTFTALITPTTDGDVTINVLAGTLTDLVGNPNTASNDIVITYDITRPTIDITTNAPMDPTNLNPFQATFTFSETVFSIDAGDLTLINATVDNFTMVSATVYTMDVLPIADGLVTIGLDEDVTEDTALNSNEAASFSITYDGTSPFFNTISTTAASPTNGPFTLTFTTNEPITGFALDDLIVTNGTASDFVEVTPQEYTALITPTITVNANVTVDINAGAGIDTATNPTLVAGQFSIAFDDIRPTIVISSDAPDPTNTTFTATFTFSEDVTGFDISDIQVENGVASGFAGSGAVYTVTITPDDDGTVTIDVDENVAEDDATNGNEAADQYSVEYDVTRPTVEVTSMAADPINGAFDVTITFDEDVTGFEMADITVGNGTASNFAGSGSVYTATITPGVDGTVTVEVLENVAEDAATNGNEASDVFEIEFDGTIPVPTITSSVPDPTNAAFDITITFTEDVTGFTLAGLDVTNGTASNLAGSGSVYTATITPTADGDVNITVLADVAFDAAGNGNGVSNEFSVLYDATNPTAVISTTAPEPVNVPFTVDIVFDENVFGFEMADLVVTNGTPSAFAGSGTTYSVVITPDGAGDVIVDIPAAVAEDLATNPNDAATFSIEYDDIPPTPPLITHISDYTCAGNAMMTGDNTLEISGTAERESTVEVFIDGVSIGTVVSDVDNGFFTFDYTGTVLSDGTYTFTAQATDIAMNTSALSAGFSITINTVDSDGDGTPDFCDEDDNGNGAVDAEEDCDGDGIVDSQDTDNSSCRAPIQQTKTYGFSPNGDGINEGWVIENITAFPNNTVSIFSRSGKLVFRQRNYQNDFEGISNQLNGNGLGTKLPVGPYVYTIDLGDGSAPVRGWLYINY